jgi:hypothetical protein
MKWCKGLMRETEEHFARFYNIYSPDNYHYIKGAPEYSSRTITVGELNSIVIVPSD